MIILKKFKTTEPTDLDKAIKRLHEKLDVCPPTSDAYDKVSDQVVKLTKLREDISSKKRVSPDVLIGAATNIAGILLITRFEKFDMITSKALGFVGKNIKS